MSNLDGKYCLKVYCFDDKVRYYRSTQKQDAKGPQWYLEHIVSKTLKKGLFQKFKEAVFVGLETNEVLAYFNSFGVQADIPTRYYRHYNKNKHNGI